MINEDKIYKIVSNLFEDLSRYKASLNESFKSNILRDVFTKNHDRDAWAKMRHYGQIKLDYDNMWLDLHNITDDMIDGVYNSPKEANIEPRTTKVPYITFRNGVTVVFNNKIKEIETPAENKFNERERNNRFRFNNDGRYISNNPHYNTFRDTLSTWNKDIENGDKPYFNGNTETKRNSTPSVVKNSYYQAAKDRYNKLSNESYLRLTEDEEHSTEKIKPTTEWMTKWYDIMNKRLFNGELGACILRPFTTGKGSNGRTLGWFKITASNIKVDRSTRRIFKSDYYSRQYVDRSSFPTICKPCIELNANYSAPEDSWLNTLVHEMCHYYTYMYGYAPKQGHGREFREIASVVSSRSNGTITIQRLASAEEMTHFDLDADIKQKNQERLDRKKSNLNVCVIILDNKQVRLVTTTSMKLLDEIANLHNTKNDTLYFGCNHEPDLVEFLYSKGYHHSMRTYRYWDISNAPWLNILPEYQWNRVIGKCTTMREALGLENKDENQPSLAVANNNNNNNNNRQEDIHLGYNIIKDGTGYNLYNTETKRKTFGNPVEKIWFDNDQNLFYFKNGKFTFIGTPGHWQKYNVQENIKRKNMEENKQRKINRKTDYLNKIVREAIEKVITEKTNDEDNSVAILPDMNLGIESPLEFD